MALLTATAEGREGLLEGLEGSLKSDGALRAQLAALLNKQMHSAGGSGGILIPVGARFNRQAFVARAWEETCSSVWQETCSCVGALGLCRASHGRILREDSTCINIGTDHPPQGGEDGGNRGGGLHVS